MKRSHIVFIAIAIFAVFGVFVATSQSQVRLTILLNGSPAANLTVTDFQTMSTRTLDATGSITYDRDLSNQDAVLVPTGKGSQRIVSLPDQGHKTVDLRGRMIISKTVKYDFGLVRSDETTEQYDLTDAEIAAIEAGEVTKAKVQELIRKEAEQCDARRVADGAFTN